MIFVLHRLKSQMLLRISNITGYHSNRDLSMKYKRPLRMDAWALKVQGFKSHRHGNGDPCSARESPWTVTPTLSWNRDLLEILNGPYVTWGLGGKWAPLSAPVGLYNVFDSSPTDRTASVGHLFEAEAAGVAETHVSTGVDDGVHCVFIANRALIWPWAWGRWESGGFGETDRWVGCRSCDRERQESKWLPFIHL